MYIKEVRAMLQKIYRKFNSLDAGQLKKLYTVSMIAIVVVLVLRLVNVIDTGQFMALLFMLFAVAFLLSAKWTEVDRHERHQLKNEMRLETLRAELSEEEFTEVQFAPVLKKYSYDSTTGYEDDNLKTSIRIMGKLQVKFFAKIEGEKVIVIAKDKDGKVIDTQVIKSAKFFQKNYKIV